MSTPLEAALPEPFESLKSKGLYRSLTPTDSPNGAFIQIGQKTFLNFSSNNYLGLASHPKVISAAQAAVKKWGAGSGASRLLSGNLSPHESLELSLARFKKEEAALTFSSGYLANLGIISTLAGPPDVVLCDRLNHASLIDGVWLSGAKLWVYPHADMEKLQDFLNRAGNFRRRLVVTDSYFGMDGDVAPLDTLLQICKDNDACFMVDEAHATGVFGEEGRGLTELFGISGQVDVVMGTLSKALGSAGGFAAGSKTLKELLINRARTFIYTTGPVPAASAAAEAAIEIMEKNPAIRKKLWQNVSFLREAFLALGLDLAKSRGPVIPVMVGDTQKAIRWSQALGRENIHAALIRPPTVPKDTDRIRFSVTAEHDKKDLEKLIAVMKKIRNLK